ncbi:MAG: O-antigen ligase family protein [Candidatus Nomurabacteria bacterium]|nr:O-antigen ligase family protein [Candidatus Nomurabacteria bacterium]
MNKYINNILNYFSYFLVFLLPIFYIGHTFVPYISSRTFLFYGFVEIMTAFWIYALVTDPSYRLSKKTLLYFLPVFSFVFWMIISGMLAISPMLSFWSSITRGTGLLTLFHCVSLSLIITSLIKHSGFQYLYRLMHWFINGGVILAISIWLSAIFNIFQDSVGGGLIGNSSFAGAYLLFVIAFILFLFVSKTNNKKEKMWLGIKTAIILFSPVFINIYGLFTGSGILGTARGAIIGVIVGLITAFVFYLLLSVKKRIRIFAIILIILGGIIFSIGWSKLMNPNTVLHKSFVQVAGGARFIFMDVAQTSMDKHPYFGYGPENYPIAFQENFNPKILLPEYHGEVWSDRSHNIYYDIGVSGGYPAIFLYILFILSIIYGLYNLKNKEIFSRTQISILAGLVVGYIFQNLFVFDSLVSLMGLFILASIIFESQDYLIKQQKDISFQVGDFVKNITIIVLIICCSTSLIFFVFMPLKKVSNYYRIVQMPIDIRVKHYNDLLNGSSIGNQLDVSEISDAMYNLYNANLVDIKNDPKLLLDVESDIKGLIVYLERSREKNKFIDVRLNTGIVFLYNTLHFLNEEPYDPVTGDHLFNLLDNTKTFSPKNPEIYWAMAQIYYWKKDSYGMIDSYKKVIDIEPGIPESYNFLLRLAKITQDSKLYNEFLEKAKIHIPDFVPN